MSISIDMSEVRALAVDMQRVDSRLICHVKPVVKKGAVNIKEQLAAEMGGSASFGHLARSITFDLVDDGFGAEIGPAKTRGRKTNLRRGANIAYFGGARGGGGTVADPKGALDAETPALEKHLADLAAELTLG